MPSRLSSERRVKQIGFDIHVVYVFVLVALAVECAVSAGANLSAAFGARSREALPRNRRLHLGRAITALVLAVVFPVLAFAHGDTADVAAISGVLAIVARSGTVLLK